MTVGELREALETMPETASVVVRIRENVEPDGTLKPLYDFRDVDPDCVVRSYDTAIVQLDE